MEKESATAGAVSDIKADVSSKKQIEFFEGLTSSADTHHSGATKKKEKQRFGLNIFNIAAPTSSRNPTPRNDRKAKQSDAGEKVTSKGRIKLFEDLTAAAEDGNSSRQKQTVKKPKFKLFQKLASARTNHIQKKAEKLSNPGSAVSREDDKSCLRRSLDVVFRSKRDENKVVKGLIGAVCGLILGVATYLGLAYALEFPMMESAIVAALTAVILCVGLALSTRCRVVVCLCMPTLSLKSGRLVLTTLAVALMLSGPLRTLSMNSTELAIMPSCTADLLYDESIKLQEMARAPFEAFKPRMMESIDGLRDQLNGLRGAWGNAKQTFDWISGIPDRLEQEIRSTLSAVSSLVPGAVYDLPGTVFNGLSSRVANAVREVDERLAFGFVVHDILEADVITIPERTDIVMNIREDVERKLALVDEILTHVKRVISLSVLIIVIQSYLYLRRTLNIDNHDNLYITPLFVKVDEQRKKQGKSSLLPLTPSERKLITDKRHVKMSPAEMKLMITSLIPAVITLLGAALVLVADYSLYEGIRYIRRANELQINIDQFTDITVERQNGVRPNTVEFSIFQDVTHQINISVCLPVGTKPDPHQYIGIGVVYVILLLTVIFQAYLIRLRHFMALYFYPEIEIRRVKALHRTLAKQRVITLLSLKDDLIEKRRANKTSVVKETEMSPFLEKLTRLCSCCLRRKKQCFICKRSESKSVKVKKCPSCRQHFCQECMDLVIGTSDCPCLDNTTNPLYNTITDSDFEQLEEIPGSSEV